MISLVVFFVGLGEIRVVFILIILILLGLGFFRFVLLIMVVIRDMWLVKLSEIK